MSISYFEGKNSGTFRKLHIIRQSLAVFPFPVALQADLDYTDDISTSEDWLTLDPLPNSGRWEENGGLDETGNPTYSYIMELVVNKDRREITAMLSDKLKLKTLCLQEDHNGEIRLVGSDEHFCSISYIQIKERGVAQPNLYRITITCTMAHAAVYYAGAFSSY